MFLPLTAFGFLIIFLPFILTAARTSTTERRMRARFAMLQTGGAGGLSSKKPTELIQTLNQQPSTGPAAIALRLATWLRLDLLVLQANSSCRPQALIQQWSLATLGCVALAFLFTRSPLLSPLFGVAAGVSPWLLLKVRAKQRLEAMNKTLPQVMDMISRALRAGHSLPAAIGIVAEEASEPARSAFGEIFQKQQFGLPMRDAFMEMIRRFPSEDLKVLVTAILVQRETGGNLVQILDRTSTVIRERLKLKGDVRVHTAQGRMTGWILCLLPLFLLGMLSINSPAYPKVLLDDPLGRRLTYAGVGLLGLGAYLIQRIVKGVEV